MPDAGFSILLIENKNLTDQSLLPSLKPTHNTISLAHTPAMATDTLAAVWPDVVVLNCLDGKLNLSKLGRAFVQSDVSLPRLLLAAESESVKINVHGTLPPDFTQQQLWDMIKSLVKHGRFIRAGQLVIDTQERKLLRQGITHDLTPKLLALLTLLVQHHGQVISRKKIMQQVWDTDFMGDTRTLDVHTRWIREMIEDEPGKPQHLITLRGVGYHFKLDVD